MSKASGGGGYSAKGSKSSSGSMLTLLASKGAHANYLRMGNQGSSYLPGPAYSPLLKSTTKQETGIYKPKPKYGEKKQVGLEAKIKEDFADYRENIVSPEQLKEIVGQDALGAQKPNEPSIYLTDMLDYKRPKGKLVKRHEIWHLAGNAERADPRLAAYAEATGKTYAQRTLEEFYGDADGANHARLKVLADGLQGRSGLLSASYKPVLAEATAQILAKATAGKSEQTTLDVYLGEQVVANAWMAKQLGGIEELRALYDDVGYELPESDYDKAERIMPDITEDMLEKLFGTYQPTHDILEHDPEETHGPVYRKKHDDDSMLELERRKRREEELKDLERLGYALNNILENDYSEHLTTYQTQKPTLLYGILVTPVLTQDEIWQQANA